ncbi:unnamed protein product [Choristocarpus tenellus]
MRSFQCIALFFIGCGYTRGENEIGTPVFQFDHQRKCTNGSYTRGHWERVPYPQNGVAGLRTAYPTVGPFGEVEASFRSSFPGEVRDPTSYQWVPNNCDLQDFSTERFCAALGDRSILFVGDSTMHELVIALMHQMNLDTECEMDRMSQGYRKVSICPGKPNKISFISNVLLTYDKGVDPQHLLPDKEVYKRCMPYFPPGRKKVCLPWASFSNDFDVVVLKSGLHMLGKTDRYMRLLRGALAALKDAKYDGKVFFVTSRAGHTFCDHEQYDPRGPGLVRGPILPGQELSSYENYRDELYASYNWYAMPRFNQIAKKIFAEAGHKVIDAYPLLRLRPDGHRGKKDCLHYNLPGPPDQLVLLLYNAILDWI